MGGIGIATSARLRPPLLLALACGPAAHAQEADPAPQQDEEAEILIIGARGSAVRDVAPIVTLDADAIAASGATTVGDLLRTIQGATQAADGTEPIFLLNAQRVSGYQEIGTLPPEAIEKVEVLPEQEALRFGYPPTRRLVNFITKRRFRQAEVKGSAGTATDGGTGTEKANLSLTRLRDDSRLTLALEYRRTDALFRSDRDIAPDPDLAFDAIGNISGVAGEIDPALSALAGGIVTVAPVPVGLGDRSSLAGYAAGDNRPRAFDIGRYRTLTPRNNALKGEAVLANRLGDGTHGSISLSAERSRDRTLAGPATAILRIPGENPFSPFAGPVLLNRYLTEADPLRQDQSTTTLNAGFLLRGAVKGWRWDLSGAFNQTEVKGVAEIGIDPAAANAAIAAGINPFVPFGASLLAGRLVDRSMGRARTTGAKAVVSNAPVRLPAGELSITATVEAERATARSSSRGANTYGLELDRSRTEGQIAIDVPIASAREDVLPFLGELSANASFAARRVGGFGSLQDMTYGLSWGPVPGLQLLASVNRREAAPAVAQQSTPISVVPNAAVFDAALGRTVIVTLIRGGNPDLEAESRLTRSLTVNVKPFAKRDLRISATYEATRVRGQTGILYAITPLTEAIVPDLFVRDSAGQLASVTYRPINFNLARSRVLKMTLNANGKIGRTPPPPEPGTNTPPPQQWSYYGGMGPSIKFLDRLQVRPGTPELDLLAGDTVSGGGTSQAYGYVYGGLNRLGNGLHFDAWYGGGNRVRDADPSGDLSFSPVFRANLGAYISVHHFLRDEDWTRRMQLRLDISNVTNDRQEVRDESGRTPNRYQPAYLEAVGRTVTLTLRKLF